MSRKPRSGPVDFAQNGKKSWGTAEFRGMWRNFTENVEKLREKAAGRNYSKEAFFSFLLVKMRHFGLFNPKLGLQRKR